MKLNEDLGELSTRGRAALLGALALCCLVPMIVLLGAVSVTGAVFGATAMVLVAAVAVVAWGAWMSRHHHSMQAGEDHDRDASERGPR